jgi:hypothetical protein
MVEVKLENYYDDPMRVYECLRCGRSGYLKRLLDNAEVNGQGQPVIKLTIVFQAFSKLRLKRKRRPHLRLVRSGRYSRFQLGSGRRHEHEGQGVPRRMSARDSADS